MRTHKVPGSAVALGRCRVRLAPDLSKIPPACGRYFSNQPAGARAGAPEAGALPGTWRCRAEAGLSNDGPAARGARCGGGGGAVFYAELDEGSFEEGFYRVLTQAEDFGDLLVAFSFFHPLQHFDFALA